MHDIYDSTLRDTCVDFFLFLPPLITTASVCERLFYLVPIFNRSVFSENVSGPVGSVQTELIISFLF